ncbi:phosphotransferase [Nocardioides sp. HDW12B]|uniref:phosphotransferase n=1 Tax=Nocardioides sp. HDW12B TaxID=2714939 RepID=UPI00197FDD6A|nr:phosphotransferase [Nocardioides sp. HDW12B]
MAEQEVDRDRAARVLEAYPEIAGEDLRLLGVGWDNTVWLVDERWTLRLPRRAAALPLLERELTVLRALAGRLPLPVPEPAYVVGPAADFPWPSWAAPVVPGVELAHAGIADEDRVDLGAQVGGFLAVLHAQTPPPGLPHDPNRRADMAVRVPWAREAVARAVGQGLVGAAPDGFEALATEADALPPTERTVLCHGDLHLRHVLVALRSGGRGTADTADTAAAPGGWAAAGVIDWGDACLADPALDLSFAYAALTGAAREAFLTGYVDGGGTAPDRPTEVRARLVAAGLCAMLATTGAEGGDPALVSENVRGIARALA